MLGAPAGFQLAAVDQLAFPPLPVHTRKMAQEELVVKSSTITHSRARPAGVVKQEQCFIAEFQVVAGETL